MNLLSLTTSIAELRRAYTGEANTTLVPATKRILARLSQSQLTQLSSVVNGDSGGFSGCLLGRASPSVDGGPTIADAWRASDEAMVGPPDVTVLAPCDLTGNATGGEIDD